MNKKDSIYISLILICIVLIAWTKLSMPKIAYVRSAKVLEEYMGMKEMQKINEAKLNKWESTIDTLQLDFDRSLTNYRENFSKLSTKEISEREELLKQQQEKLEQYKMTIQQKAEEETEKATQGVLNQINSFIKDYSIEKGYDIILGVTASGNILYGAENTDVTDDVIEGLNTTYKGRGE